MARTGQRGVTERQSGAASEAVGSSTGDWPAERALGGGEEGFSTTAPPSIPAFARPQRARRRLLTFGVLGLVGVGLYLVVATLRSNGEDTPNYRTVKLQRGDLRSEITATGTLKPLVAVAVGAQISGRLKDVLVDFNSHVKKGQVLARIDPELYQAEQAQAVANLTSARAKVAQAKAKEREAELAYQRDRNLLAQKVVAQAEVDSRLATYDSAKAEVSAAHAAVAQAQAALVRARANVAYTTIVSPIDGVVISRSVDVGQTVAASLQAPTLFTIAEDLRKMEVHTNVAESDVGAIVVGQKVNFTVDAFSDETFDGTVKQLRYEAQTVSNVVTYDAVVSVDNGALKLRPGMTATVSFITARRENVLRLPNAALRFRPPAQAQIVAPVEGDKQHLNQPPRKRSAGGLGDPAGRGNPRALRKNVKRVWVLEAGKLRAITVRLGISSSEYSEVVSGQLREGSVVVVGVEANNGARQQGGPPGARRRKRLL